MTTDGAERHAQLVVAEALPFRIRRKHPDDFPDDYAWRRDTELARFDGRPVLDIAYEEFAQQAAYDARYTSPWHESFSIIEESGTHAGNAMYYNVSAGRDSAEIGMVLAAPSLRGHGHGSRLAVAFVRYLWSAHPFRQLLLHTLEWNSRSIGCFARAGFEATARVLREDAWFVRMEARREWWLLWDAEGRFDRVSPLPRTARAAVPETGTNWD